MSSKREHLLDTAINLFYEHGCQTTGIDRILAEAGVAKMTMYSHFKSKDELIVAAINRLSDREIEKFLRIVGDGRHDPLKRLHAFFDHLEQKAGEPTYLGCPFLKVAVEYPETTHPVHRASADYKLAVERQLVRNLREAGAADPEVNAKRIMLLTQGALTMVQLTGDLDYMHEARRASEELLQEILPQATAG